MKERTIRSARLLALFVLGCLLLNYPLLAIFNIRAFIGGIPILCVYLFVCWLAVIILTAIAAKEPPSAKPRSGVNRTK